MGSAMAAQQSTRRFRLPDGSRSVQSPWVWRGFAFMSIVAFGFALIFAVGHEYLYAACWAFITAGWFAISMWLWRKHIRDDDLAYQEARQTKSQQFKNSGRGA
jgi:hypothetical protein